MAEKNKTFQVYNPDDEIDISEHPDYVDGIRGEKGLQPMGVGDPDGNGGQNSEDVPSCERISGKYTGQLSTGEKITARIDLDGMYPQSCISIEQDENWHIIAEVHTGDDRCLFTKRVVIAQVFYLHPKEQFARKHSLAKGSKIKFSASKLLGQIYKNFMLEFKTIHGVHETVELSFVSQFFDVIDIKVDAVECAGEIFTSYKLDSHPHKPLELEGTQTIKNTFQGVGFDVDLNPDGTVFPMVSMALASSENRNRWSNREMHNAMNEYWLRKPNESKWAMWLLYANLHEKGSGLGGVMFDKNINGLERQGTAVFTKSFISTAPENDPDKDVWRQRMQFWAAIHEIGHGFNLNHPKNKVTDSFWSSSVLQKLQIKNSKNILSFMSYPSEYFGGQENFFSRFRFNFDDSELLFMRHAPRSFVRMGGAARGEDHAFSETNISQFIKLEIFTHGLKSVFRLMELVKLRMKLTNISDQALELENDFLSNPQNFKIFVQHENEAVKQWLPMEREFWEHTEQTLEPSSSITATQTISYTPSGWLIARTGRYLIQAITSWNGVIVKSNVIEIFVKLKFDGEERFAAEFLDEDVARIIHFRGVPSLPDATKKIEDFVNKTDKDNLFFDHPLAIFAEFALVAPKEGDFKHFQSSAWGDHGQAKVSFVEKDLELVTEAYAKWLVKEPKTSLEQISFKTDDIIEGTISALANSEIDKFKFNFLKEELRKRK